MYQAGDYVVNQANGRVGRIIGPSIHAGWWVIDRPPLGWVVGNALWHESHMQLATGHEVDATA